MVTLSVLHQARDDKERKPAIPALWCLLCCYMTDTQ